MALEEAVVATLFDQSDEIADEIERHTPLLSVLKEKGNIRKFSGGYEIRKPVLYNNTAVGGFYTGFEAFTLDAVDDMTAFQFDIKQVYEPMSISGRDRRANRDEEMLLDHVEAKIDAAKSRLKNKVSISLLGDGTGSGGREFDGIQKMISTTPTSGTYGGISRSANTFAQNQDIVASATMAASNIQEELTNAILQITRGAESPDLGLMHRQEWKFLHSSLTAIQRITKSERKGVAGFKAIAYDGVDFVFDGGYTGPGGSATLTAGEVRLINTNYVSFDVERSTYMKPLEDKMRRPVDQDAHFTVIVVEGNLCCSAPQLQASLANS